MLHLISQVSTAVLERIGDNDELVFLENALLQLLKTGRYSDSLEKLLKTHQLYALADELAVRGILPDELVIGIQSIDYSTLVELTVKHRIIQSWS
jgi:sulfur relay protein TusB/DsrH